MSLGFDGSTDDVVNFGSDASIDNLTTGTQMVWAYRNALTRDGAFAYKNSGTRTFYQLDTAKYRCTMVRATTGYHVRVDDSAIPVYALNKWVFIAFIFDTAGADGDQQIWGGDLTTPAVEASSYQNQIVGSGAVTDDSGGNLTIGQTGSDSKRWEGFIAFYHLTNVTLTGAQIVEQQFNPHVLSSSIVYSHLGFNGLGTQADWSGNGNNGIVTSCTVEDHVPLRQIFGLDNIYPTPTGVAPGGLSIPVAMHSYRRRRVYA